MATAIETFALSKSYGSTAAVRDLDLSVQAGEVFGFLGPNGAGKSTTIRLLLGLQRPTSGRVVVLGLDGQRARAELSPRIGYLPGELALFPRMTGQEHLDWFTHARRADSAQASRLIERFSPVLDRPVHDLSKGNRQKIGLILAFLHRPELLILDEPTSGLDPLVQTEFERLLREVVEDGGTVFLSSHDLDVVQRIATRVAVIRAGSVVMSGTVQALRRDSPLKITATFPADVEPTPFRAVEGVSIESCSGGQLVLQVPTRSIAAVLHLIANRNPIDVAATHADLEELFAGVYQDQSPHQEARSDAG